MIGQKKWSVDHFFLKKWSPFFPVFTGVCGFSDHLTTYFLCLPEKFIYIYNMKITGQMVKGCFCIKKVILLPYKSVAVLRDF